MLEAINLSQLGMDNNDGGPFGCIVVKDDVIVGRGNNKVTSSNDPTAHAEVMAIRDACANLNTYQLTDCEIYTSCEPCPMCLGAIYWARPKALYFAGTREDAANAGFDDAHIYDEIGLPFETRRIPTQNILRHGAQNVFNSWVDKPDKIDY